MTTKPQKIGARHHHWLQARRYATAGAIAAFPFLFIFDDARSGGVSPVLPGLLVILVAWLLIPPISWELARRFRKPPEPSKLRRQAGTARAAILVAAIWFTLWLAVGA